MIATLAIILCNRARLVSLRDSIDSGANAAVLPSLTRALHAPRTVGAGTASPSVGGWV